MTGDTTASHQAVALDDSTRERIIQGIKAVLSAAREQGLFDGEEDYDGLLEAPSRMKRFIDVYKANREIGRMIAVDRNGRPVLDDDTALVCGPTLADVEHNLLYSCAKRVFARITGRAFVEGTSRVDTPILEAARRYLGHEWQWPLLDAYGEHFQALHFDVLGPTLLYLKTPDEIATIGAIGKMGLETARDLAGADFDDLMRNRPTAIRGLAMCNAHQFALFKELTGERLWEFLTADKAYVAEMMRTSEDRLAALAPVLADMCQDSWQVLQPLPGPTLKAFVDTYLEAFGKPGAGLLGMKGFAREFLIDLVGSIRKENVSSAAGYEHVVETARFKLNALKPKVIAWLRQGRA